MKSKQQTPSFGIKNRNRKAWWISGGVAIVVLAAFAGTAQATEVFTSPKQVVLHSIDKIGGGSKTAVSAEQQWSFQVKNLKVPNLPPTTSALVSSLNHSTIGIDMMLDSKNDQAQVNLSTNYQSVARHASVWVTNNKAIASASNFQNLLRTLLPSTVKIPKYLVTDSAQSKSIVRFWTQLNQASSTYSQQSIQASRQLAQLVVQAIPTQYFHRQGLSSISLSFDQQGLQEIVKSEVRFVYAHPDQYASLISQIESNHLVRGTTPAQVKQSIQQTISNTPEEVVMAGISTALGSGDLTVAQTTITVHQGLFGVPTESMTGGIGVNVPQSGIGGELDYQMTTGPLKTAISPPTPSASSSKTFTQFAASLLGLH